MTGFEFGDIVLVRFPFTDQSTTKKRPAVVVSSDGYHRARPDVIVMAVTGHLQARGRFGEVTLQEWKAAGLLKASVVKPILATLERELILRRLGTLQAQDRASLRQSLRTIFGA